MLLLLVLRGSGGTGVWVVEGCIEVQDGSGRVLVECYSFVLEESFFLALLIFFFLFGRSLDSPFSSCVSY